MNKQFQKVVSDLELLVREDLVEHEDIRSFGIETEDNYIINPRSVIQDAVKLLKEDDSALRGMVYQYCTVEYREKEEFFHRFISAGEEAFKVLGIENGEEVTDEFIWS